MGPTYKRPMTGQVAAWDEPSIAPAANRYRTSAWKHHRNFDGKA
jgi:hypothetical protein